MERYSARYHTVSCPAWVMAAILGLGMSVNSMAQAPDDMSTLRQKLAQQETLLREQRELLQKQQEALSVLTSQLEGLKRRMGELEKSARTAPPPSAAPSAGSQAAAAIEQRDAVGDLNAGSVAAGTFPGSFVIPGSREVSLAIGGFVKTVAIADSRAEALGSNMLPSTLGTQRLDARGKFAIDSTLTRLYLDARAPAGSGSLRGYIEYDLNANNNNTLGFKLRHAYGSWRSGSGTLTAGHTWSALMDLKILPEGLTEPTVSGAIFNRQPQLRWTQSLGEGTKADLSVEHPSVADVVGDESFQTRARFPDFIGAIEFGRSDVGHLRLGGIVRRIEIANADDSLSAAATGWGLSMGAHLESVGRDRMAFSGSYGRGLGRYLLGLGSTAAGMFDSVDSRLRLRDNYGGLFWYQHYWSQRLRSTGAVGHARADTLDSQTGDEFKSTSYAYGNLMWTILPYLNVGFEYDFGSRTTKDGSHKDNHRLVLGMQIF